MNLNAQVPPGINGPADWASPTDTSSYSLDKEKMVYAKNFEFDGHTYLLFIENDAKGMRQVIHDPECPCFKKEEKK